MTFQEQKVLGNQPLHYKICIQHSVDCDRIYTKNNTLPTNERVEVETVTRGRGATRRGVGKWVGREGQREWEGKVGVR